MTHLPNYVVEQIKAGRETVSHLDNPYRNLSNNNIIIWDAQESITCEDFAVYWIYKSDEPLTEGRKHCRLIIYSNGEWDTQSPRQFQREIETNIF